MKYFKLSNPILLCFAVIMFFGISSCKKVKVFEPLGDDGPKYIGIMTYGGPEGFGASSLSFDMSQANSSFEARMVYTGAGVFSEDVTLTLGNDAAALAKFNASQPSGGIIYDAFTAAQYSLPSTTVVLKKGQSMSEPFTVIFHPNQLDPSKSYMLPLAITSIAGAPADVAKAPGTSVAYLHVIGNYLAGNYTWRYRRWQSGDTTTAPLQDLLSTTSLSPISASQLMTRETYTETFIDPAGGIVLGFTEIGGVLSNFTLSLLPSTIAGISAGGFILASGPKFTAPGFILVGNTGSQFIGTQFATYIQYINSTGGVRTLCNEFTKIP